MHFFFVEHYHCWAVFSGAIFAGIRIFFNDYAEAFFWVFLCVFLEDWLKPLAKRAPSGIK
jgi:hypothetical protein